MKVRFRTGLRDSGDILLIDMLYCPCLFNNLEKRDKGKKERKCCLHMHEKDLIPEGI